MRTLQFVLASTLVASATLATTQTGTGAAAAPIRDGASRAAATPGTPFDATLAMQGIGFRVTCANEGSINTLRIVPAGLAAGQRPVEQEVDGTVTAASSSSISDGGAALVLASESAARDRGAKPIARIVSYASHAQAPEWFTIAPGPAIQKALDRAGWKASDVDLYEINEAFAVVTMAAVRDLGLDMARVNVNGGACALGHPIGATGARLLVTLVHALRKRGLRRGVASQCIGGGEATAMAVEIID